MFQIFHLYHLVLGYPLRTAANHMFPPHCPPMQHRAGAIQIPLMVLGHSPNHMFPHLNHVELGYPILLHCQWERDTILLDQHVSIYNCKHRHNATMIIIHKTKPTVLTTQVSIFTTDPKQLLSRIIGMHEDSPIPCPTPVSPQPHPFQAQN